MPRPLEVDTVTVRPGDAVRSLGGIGRLRRGWPVGVGAWVAGALVAGPFGAGEGVSAGAPVARIDVGLQRAPISEAAAAIGAQEALVGQARRDLARFAAMGEVVT